MYFSPPPSPRACAFQLATSLLIACPTRFARLSVPEWQPQKEGFSHWQVRVETQEHKNGQPTLSRRLRDSVEPGRHAGVGREQTLHPFAKDPDLQLPKWRRGGRGWLVSPSFRPHRQRAHHHQDRPCKYVREPGFYLYVLYTVIESPGNARARDGGVRGAISSST